MAVNSTLFNRTITVKGFTPDGTTYSLDDKTTDNPAFRRAFIETISDESVALSGRALGSTFYIYISEAGSDIEVGDKIIDDKGREYLVQGKAINDFGISTSHDQLVCVIDENKDT